jgi:hypothetical protein
MIVGSCPCSGRRALIDGRVVAMTVDDLPLAVFAPVDVGDTAGVRRGGAAIDGHGLVFVERLFVSRRTVETHITHVFGKLAMSSRTQLVAISQTTSLTSSASALRSC